MAKTYEEIVNEARRRAMYSGLFTEDAKELNGSTYLVKDIEEVVKAFVKDIENDNLAEHESPEDFLNAHGIKWE